MILEICVRALGRKELREESLKAKKWLLELEQMGILSCVCYVRYWGNRACFVLESFGKKLRSENWRLSLCVENQPKVCYKVNRNSAVLKKYQIFYNMVHIIIKKLEGKSNIKIIGGR